MQQGLCRSTPRSRREAAGGLYAPDFKRRTLSVRAAERTRFVGGIAVFARVVAVFHEAVVQRLQADAENFRGARLHAAALLERGQNQLTVGFGERRAERNRDRRARS